MKRANATDQGTAASVDDLSLQRTFERLITSFHFRIHPQKEEGGGLFNVPTSRQSMNPYDRPNKETLSLGKVSGLFNSSHDGVHGSLMTRLSCIG